MVPRTTRLEYSIVVIALLVLLFCSKPPRPGTAGVNQPEELYPESAEQNGEILNASNEERPAEPDMTLTPSDFELIEDTPSEPEEEEMTPAESLFDDSVPAPLPIPKITGTSDPDRIVSPNRTTTRLVTLNAGDSVKPRRNENTQGDVSVRWIWNGQEFVPQKVRVVREPNGVTKVWSLDKEDKTK